MNTGYTPESRSTQIQVPPGLEPQHVLPEETITGYFDSPSGHKLCFANYIPPGATHAVIVIPATNEFAEKHAPLMHRNAEKGIATFTLERYGHGLSARQYAEHPQRMSAKPMSEHVADLARFIDISRGQMTLHGMSNAPVTLLGLSQGALVAAHLLHEQPGQVDNVIFGVPMFGQHDLDRKTRIDSSAFNAASFFLNRRYGSNSGTVIPTAFEHMIEKHLAGEDYKGHFSVEYQRLNPHLCSHVVTRGWIEETQIACQAAKTPEFANAITTPSLVIVAQERDFVETGKGREDECVNNDIARQFAQHSPNTAYVPITGPHDLLTGAPPSTTAETIAACDAFVQDPAGFIATHPAPPADASPGILKRFIQIPISRIFGGSATAEAPITPIESAPATPLPIESEYSGPAPA